MRAYACLCVLMQVWRTIYLLRKLTIHPIGLSQMCRDIVPTILTVPPPPPKNERFFFFSLTLQFVLYFSMR